MVLFLDYKITVPKASFDAYYKYILKGIYNFKSWPGDAKIVRETETEFDIEFTMCNYVPIALVLPWTIKSSTHENSIDPTLYDRIKGRIGSQVSVIRSEVMKKLSPLDVGNLSLETLVHQLAHDEEIDKFARCDHGVYLVFMQGVPLFLQIINGQLRTAGACFVNFHPDDGFTGFDMTELNNYFRHWKEVGDVTAPIIPANNLDELPIKVAMDD